MGGRDGRAGVEELRERGGGWLKEREKRAK